jgi:hypothetical protein
VPVRERQQNRKHVNMGTEPTRVAGESEVTAAQRVGEVKRSQK